MKNNYFKKAKDWCVSTVTTFKYYIIVFKTILPFVKVLIHTSDKNDDWVKITKVNFFKNKATYYNGRFGYVENIGRTILYREATIREMYEKYISYCKNGSSDIMYDREIYGYIPVDKDKQPD